MRLELASVKKEVAEEGFSVQVTEENGAPLERLEEAVLELDRLRPSLHKILLDRRRQ